MRLILGITLTAALLCCSISGFAQQPAAPPARPEANKKDVESIDAIVHALYDVISGPAGAKRDWNRMRSLFYVGAKMMPIVKKKEGGFAILQWDVEDYITRSGPQLEANGFYEREISRKQERYGNLVHVFTTYESKRKAEDAQPFARGINSLQLMNDGTRWWIISISWESERPDNPLPKEYLK